MYGPERLKKELLNIGYKVEEKEDSKGNLFFIIKNYSIELGRFKGREIDLGIQATKDYPRTVVSSIHVKAFPQLLEKADSEKKVRNIVDSILGSEWRYWSHNFNWKSEKSARRLMIQINRIFLNA